MTVSLYLAKVLGLGLVILGVAIMVRRHYFIPVFGAMAEQRLLRTMIAVVQLLAGLFLALGHDTWSPLPAAIMTILGWMAVIEAASYLLLPDAIVARYINAPNKPAVYIVGGALAIAIGAWLGGFGFGWW